jgi:hypothetical protein
MTGTWIVAGPCLGAALFALAAPMSNAWGRTVYKSVMPDGAVVYGDRPAKGAATSEARTLDLGQQPLSWATETDARRLQQRADALNQAHDELRAAETTLRRLEAQHDARFAATYGPNTVDDGRYRSGRRGAEVELYRLQRDLDAARARVAAARARLQQFR